MSLPEGPFAIAVLIALAIPGIVFVSVRGMLRGSSTEDKDLASRLSQAITISVLLNAAYLLWFAPTLAAGLTITTGEKANVDITDAPTVGRNILIFAVAIPAALALLRYLIPWGRWTWLRGRLGWLSGSRSLVNRTPTAWDYAARSRADMLVRVWKPDGATGRWIGGWYSGKSYMSGYPESRDLFIESQSNMGADGSFGPLPDESRGVWVSIRDEDIVEWIVVPDQDGGNADE